MTTDKSREARVRRMLARQGYALSRSRRRDPRATDYGRYTISKDGTAVYEARGLDDAERWTLAEDAARQAGQDGSGWQQEGWVGIDTGRLMLADPAYPALMAEGNFVAGDCEVDGISAWSPHGQSIAVIVGNFGGDGLYPVRVRRDDDGRVNAVRVDFTYDEEIQP
jgi:hypothetical protein